MCIFNKLNANFEGCLLQSMEIRNQEEMWGFSYRNPEENWPSSASLDLFRVHRHRYSLNLCRQVLEPLSPGAQVPLSSGIKDSLAAKRGAKLYPLN